MINTQSRRAVLSLQAQKVYDALLNGLLDKKDSIRVFEKDHNVIVSIFEFIKQDYPQLYYVDGIQCQSYSGSAVITVLPIYNAHIKNTYSLDQQINAIGRRIMSQVNTSDVWRILLYFHDSICRTVAYVDTGSDAHTIVGSLIQKRAVCDGISRAFKYFCDLAGIECRTITGKAKRSSDSSSFERHAWNKVKIQGKWYNVDVTFDLTIGDPDSIRHDYFMVDDNSLIKSHVENRPIYYPANSKGLDYYTVNNLVNSAQNGLSSYIRTQYGKGVRYFEIKLPDTQNVGNVQERVFNLVSEALRNQCMSFRMEMRPNEDMLVFGIRIS